MTLWRIIRLGTYTSAVGVIAALAIPVTADRRPECKQAADWVQAHKSALPKTLAEVAAFPTAYRHAIVNALPPETRADLWRARLTEVLSRSLTDAQRDVVREGLEIVRPELYAPEPRKYRVPDQWKARAHAAFANGNAKYITALADDEGSFRTFNSALVAAKRQWESFGTALALPGLAPKLPWCTCSTIDSFECSGGYVCCGYGYICENGLQYDCGALGGDVCDGLCKLPSHPSCVQ